MKKLIVLSLSCFLVLGAFANTGHKTKQEDAKAKTQHTSAAPQAAAKTESKPAAGKDEKGVKKGKKMKGSAAKKGSSSVTK